MKKVIDIKPIMANFVTILNENDLDEVIELPLLEPCKELYKKNIQTIMSSCNMYNIIGLNNYYKAGVMSRTYPYGEHFAWITIDYDSLSDNNKKIIAEKHDQNPELFLYISENPHDNYNTPIDFKKRREDKVDTIYYTPRNIILRYPLNENTTSKEVSDYYLNIIKDFEKQKQISNEKSPRAQLIELAKKYKNNLKKMNYTVNDNLFYDPCITDFDIKELKEYIIDGSGELERLLFIIRILDIYSLLTPDSIITDIIFNKDYIYFMMNNEEYIIGLKPIPLINNFIQLGNIKDGKEILLKQKELLDLYSKFDHYHILSKVKSQTTSSINKLS